MKPIILIGNWDEDTRYFYGEMLYDIEAMPGLAEEIAAEGNLIEDEEEVSCRFPNSEMEGLLCPEDGDGVYEITDDLLMRLGECELSDVLSAVDSDRCVAVAYVGEEE